MFSVSKRPDLELGTTDAASSSGKEASGGPVITVHRNAPGNRGNSMEKFWVVAKNTKMKSIQCNADGLVDATGAPFINMV